PAARLREQAVLDVLARVGETPHSTGGIHTVADLNEEIGTARAFELHGAARDHCLCFEVVRKQRWRTAEVHGAEVDGSQRIAGVRHDAPVLEVERYGHGSRHLGTGI